MNWTLLGALLGFAGVAAGAFGAHGLRSLVTPQRLEIFETAVRYQMIHALAILLAGLLGAPQAGWCFAAGIGVFCGSLYLLVLTDQRWLGAVTPIGGLLFLAGWALLALASRK
ncbi:MAG: DUF423 domain-containing protein [Deltaproteobacteria bacterium]|nr:DUF423 domain-containing protein [Deltaproteobacteria bacterium]